MGTDDVPRDRYAAVGREQWQPGVLREVRTAAGGQKSRRDVGGAEEGELEVRELVRRRGACGHRHRTGEFTLIDGTKNKGFSNP